jgi:KamA family protein
MDAWQKDFGDAFVHISELLDYLEITPKDQKPFLELSGSDFPVRVPRPFAERMQKGNLKDPLLLQVLASSLEQAIAPGFNTDPVGDQARMRYKSMIQKYRGRALIITTGACAIHCRYCFRKAFPYDEQSLTPRHTKQLLQEITSDSSLSEIILSGGDPLSLSDDRLANLIQGIASIPHVRTLRIHTRLPVVIPNRVTPNLLALLDTLSLQKVIVIHANHAAELDESVEKK